MNFLDFLNKKIELLKKLDSSSASSRLKTSTISNLNSIFGDGVSKADLDNIINYQDIAQSLNNSKSTDGIFNQSSVDVGNIFEEFINTIGSDNIDGVLDEGYKDGVITSQELESYMEKLMGDDNKLSMSDFEEAINSAQIDLEKEFEKQKTALESEYINKTPEKQPSGNNATSRNSGGITPSTNKTPQNPKTNAIAKAPKDMSLEELKNRKSELINNFKDIGSVISSAQQAKEENKEKETKYIEELRASEDETAQNLANTIQNISQQESTILSAQQNIVNSNNIISALQSDISTLNGNISTWQAQISTLEAAQNTSDENIEAPDYSEEIATLKNSITEAQQLIQEKNTKINEENANIVEFSATITEAQANISQLRTQQTDLENNLSSTIKENIAQVKNDYETSQKEVDEKISQAKENFDKAQNELNEVYRYIALKDKPEDFSQKGEEILDKINNPDENTQLDEKHYQDLFNEINNNEELSISEKMYLMTQMKSAINTDSSLVGLENMFKEFIEQDNIKAEIENDKTGTLKYQADFIQNNSSETLGNLKVNAEAGPLIIDGIKYQKIEAQQGSADGIYEYAIIAPEGVDVNADLPVLFYLTGRGTNEAGMEAAQYNVFGSLFGIGGLKGFNGIVVIPLSSGKATDVTDSHANDVVNICDEIKAQYPNADTSNMGMIGFSDGATRAYQLANKEQLNGGSNYHFDSVLMIDRAEGYSAQDDEAFINHGISLGVYSSNVYNSECQNINAAEFNQCISSDHVDAQYKACNRNTLEWLFKNRV